MKKTLLILFAIFFIAGSELLAKPRPGVSFNFFYSSLRPYGEWIELEADIYAWRPSLIERNWRPYANGRWNWTHNGWYWDSYEPFGWAVYHYGRWYDDDYYGWIWIPDYEWGPAWVEWRYDNDYIGWAPLPPYASFHIDFGIRFSIGWNSSYRWWNFVPYRRFCDSRLDYYLLDHRRISRIFDRTKYRNNYYYDRDRIVNGGIDRSFVEKRGGYRVAEREIRSINDREEYNRLRSRDNERVYTYRPSDSEVGRVRNDDKFEIKRSERSLSLEREKITTPRITDRNFESQNERSRDAISGRERVRNDEPRSIEKSPETSERILNRQREEIQKRESEQREVNRQREELRKRESQQQEINRQREEESRREVQKREAATERSRAFERQQSENRAERERKVESRREPSVERRESRRESNSRSESRSESRSVERRR